MTKRVAWAVLAIAVACVWDSVHAQIRLRFIPATIESPSGECLAADDCYPKPTSSGVGFTGIPSGETATGSCTTSPSSGATLSNCLYSGNVTITTTGSGATIRYSRFTGQVTHAGSGTLIVEYSTHGPTSGCQTYDNSLAGSNYESRYSRFNTSVSEGPRVAGSNIYIHDNFVGPMCSNPGDHADGVQGFGGGTNIRVYHNTFDLRTASDVNAAIFFADASEEADVRDNLVMGGTYVIKLNDDFTPDHGPWILIGNRIVNGAWQFGPMANIGTSFTGSTCSDNRLVTIDSSYNITSLGSTVSC